VATTYSPNPRDRSIDRWFARRPSRPAALHVRNSARKRCFGPGLWRGIRDLRTPPLKNGYARRSVWIFHLPNRANFSVLGATSACLPLAGRITGTATGRAPFSLGCGWTMIFATARTRLSRPVHRPHVFWREGGGPSGSCDIRLQQQNKRLIVHQEQPLPPDEDWQRRDTNARERYSLQLTRSKKLVSAHWVNWIKTPIVLSRIRSIRPMSSFKPPEWPLSRPKLGVFVPMQHTAGNWRPRSSD